MKLQKVVKSRKIFCYSHQIFSIEVVPVDFFILIKNGHIKGKKSRNPADQWFSEYHPRTPGSLRYSEGVHKVRMVSTVMLRYYVPFSLC